MVSSLAASVAAKGDPLCRVEQHHEESLWPLLVTAMSQQPQLLLRWRAGGCSFPPVPCVKP